MPRDYVRTRPLSRAPQKSSRSSGAAGLLAGIFIGLIIAGVFYIKNHSIPSASSQNFLTNDRSATKMPASSSAQAIFEKSAPLNADTNINAAKTLNNNPKKTSPQTLQTQFDFYNVLPSQKIMGPSGDEDISALTPATSTQSLPSSPNTPNSSGLKNLFDKNTTVNTDNSEYSKDNKNNKNPDISSDLTVNNSATVAAEPEESVSKTPAVMPKIPAAAVPVSPPKKHVSSQKFSTYIIQTGVFKDYAGADQLKAQLMLLGFDVKVNALQKKGQNLQRVWLGPFHSQAEAESMVAQLKENGFSAQLLKSDS